jgi:hypothetical protein
MNALVEARTHALEFATIRRNVVIAVVLASLAGCQVVVIALPLCQFIAEGLLEASPADVLGVVLRNQMFASMLAGVIGLSASAADQRSGLLAARIGAWGRRPVLAHGLWLYALATACIMAIPVAAVPFVAVSRFYHDGAPLAFSALALALPLSAVALLHHVAWGVLCGCVTDRYWLQLGLLVGIPWIFLPVLRAALFTQGSSAVLPVFQLLPFESSAALSAWSGSANTLTGVPAQSPVPLLFGSLALVGVAVVLHWRRTMRGRVDPS